MRHALRDLIVCLFAVALVFNGGAFRALAKAPGGHSHHVAVAHTGHPGQHETRHLDQRDDVIVAFDAFGDLPAHDYAHGHSKCCTMCGAFDNLRPTFVAAVSLFRYRAVVFTIGRQRLVGHLVPLDPDIPKTIV